MNQHAKTFNLGKTKVNIVCPEQILGRKMTEAEKQAILDDIKRINIDILKHRIAKGEI